MKRRPTAAHLASFLAGLALGFLVGGTLNLAVTAGPTETAEFWDGPIIVLDHPGEPAYRLEPYLILVRGERIIDREADAGPGRRVKVGFPASGAVVYAVRAE